jgi:hypothetical protein
MLNIEDVFYKNYILQFTENENSEINKILGSLNCAVFTNRIVFDCKIINGVIQPLDELSKLIGIKDINMYLKLIDNSSNVVGKLCIENCKFLSILNFDKHFRFSLKNTFDKIDKIENIDVSYRFERITYNGMTLIESKNPLNSLKNELTKKFTDKFTEQSEYVESKLVIDDIFTQEIYNDYERPSSYPNNSRIGQILTEKPIVNRVTGEVLTDPYGTRMDMMKG